MSKYKAEVQEKAYELFMIQQLSFTEVMKRMREGYPTFAKNTLTKWKNDSKLGWAGRYDQYCRALAEKSDKERIKKIKPIVEVIEDIRDKIYERLLTALKRDNIVTEKNIGLVLSAFVRMSDLEYKMKGGRQFQTPAKQVINIILAVLEKNPRVGPAIKASKREIVDAIFEEIEGE